VKKFLFIIAFSFITYANFAQDLLMDTEDVYEADVIQPKFNGGGLEKFYDYINANFDFKTVTKSGKMVVSFSVATTGEIKDIRVVEFVDVDAAAEIIRLLQESPKWESAKRNGKPFSVNIKLPLQFKK
jgi:pantothenate kinase